MTVDLSKIECPCGFAVQGHDADEVARIVKNHAKQSHDHDLTDNELREAMRTVEAPVQ